MKQIKPIPCVCGAEARVRYKAPFAWVECKKKCGMTSGYVGDKAGEYARPETEQAAIVRWNAEVRKRGRSEYVY